MRTHCIHLGGLLNYISEQYMWTFIKFINSLRSDQSANQRGAARAFFSCCLCSVGLLIPLIWLEKHGVVRWNNAEFDRKMNKLLTTSVCCVLRTFSLRQPLVQLYYNCCVFVTDIRRVPILYRVERGIRINSVLM